ncbi:MAG: hypothetical protein ACYCZZ_03700 [Minisyncoccota bacterium]
MKKTLSSTSAAVVGIVFGVLGAHSVLAGSWLALIVWSIVGLLVGAFIEEQRLVRAAGIFYGFFVIFSYFLSGFRGSLDTISGFAMFSLIAGSIGALYGWFLVALGNLIKRKIL